MGQKETAVTATGKNRIMHRWVGALIAIRALPTAPVLLLLPNIATQGCGLWDC
jgi:hypothetical protein